MSGRPFEGEREAKRSPGRETEYQIYFRSDTMLPSVQKKINEGEKIIKGFGGFRAKITKVDISQDHDTQGLIKKEGFKLEYPIFSVWEQFLGNLDNLKEWVEKEKEKQKPQWVVPGKGEVAGGSLADVVLTKESEEQEKPPSPEQEKPSSPDQEKPSSPEQEKEEKQEKDNEENRENEAKEHKDEEDSVEKEEKEEIEKKEVEKDKEHKEQKEKKKKKKKEPNLSPITWDEFVKLLKVGEMKKLLKKKGLETSGKRTELLEKLEKEKVVDLTVLTVAQLKKLLSDKMLDSEGNKSELIERLKHPEEQHIVKEKDGDEQLTKLSVKKLGVMLKEKHLPTTFNGLLQLIGEKNIE